MSKWLWVIGAIILFIIFMLLKGKDWAMGSKLVELDRQAELVSAQSGYPLRFAKCSDNVYRGGQPSLAHLKKLKELGVTTVICLRKEAIFEVAREKANCEKVGLEFIHRPTFGVFGFSEKWLNRVMKDLADPGKVYYVHCRHGRDRTSVVCCSYKVIYHGEDIEQCWENGAVAFDHQGDRLIYQNFHPSYVRYLENKKKKGQEK